MCKGATVFILNNKRNPSRRPKMNATNPENCLSMFLIQSWKQ